MELAVGWVVSKWHGKGNFDFTEIVKNHELKLVVGTERQIVRFTSKFL